MLEGCDRRSTHVLPGVAKVSGTHRSLLVRQMFRQVPPLVGELHCTPTMLVTRLVTSWLLVES